MYIHTYLIHTVRGDGVPVGIFMLVAMHHYWLVVGYSSTLVELERLVQVDTWAQ